MCHLFHLATAYGVWGRVGGVGSVILGINLLDESANAARLASAALMIAVITGMKLTSPI